MKSRSEIEKEVEDDLAKTDAKLLVDIHEELLHDERSIPENLIHAQKRLASLSVSLARQSEEVTKQTKKLNDRLLWLTWVLVILTAILLLISFIEVPKITVLSPQRTNQENKDSHQSKLND